MPLNVNFNTWKVPELRDFLQDRGISCSLARKLDLLRLCELANELDLEILRSEDDYKVMDMQRRTITNACDGRDIVIDEISVIKEWNKRLNTLPDIGYCDILIFLLQYCKWSENRLKLYKSDNGYRLFQANHIDNVEVSPLLHDHYLYVKATCVPETRQTASPYNVWILIHDSGEVKSGGCTCVADNGTCKHCVALLFGLTSFCDRHQDRATEVGTDVACVWDKPRMVSTPMEIDNINTGIDTALPPPITPTHANYQPHVSTLPPSTEIEKQFKQMCKGTGALLLQSLYTDSDESDLELENASLPTLSNIIKSSSTYLTDLQKAFDSDTIQQIEEETRGQSDNPEWFHHKKGRITASNFFSVMHFRYTDAEENYISKQIMGKTIMKNSPSVSFGKANEPIARQLYFENYKKVHKRASINLTGLFIDKVNPYIGASPDGLVHCECCGDGLVEIKCSFTYQNSTPQEACQDHHYHVYIDENNKVRLKDATSWYIQIQGQLGVCKKKWCDFVLYTKKGFIVDRIYYDENKFADIVKASKRFFERYIINALVEEIE